MTVLAFDGVDYAYGDHPAVEDVSLTVDAGTFLGVVGPNGSGKSTLLELALGVQRPDRGTVTLFGVSAHRFRDGTRVGYVAQRPADARRMPITVREVVRMGRYPHVRLRFARHDHEAVAAAMDRLGVTDLADRRLGTLSGGQRQRVLIARALASEADLLVLDEPTVGVDAGAVAAFYDLLSDLNADGMTVVLVEHDVGAVAAHADRVVCIDRHVCYDGPAAEFADAPVDGRTAHRFLAHDRSGQEGR